MQQKTFLPTLAIVAALVLGGCTVYSLQPSGKQAFDDTYTVSTGVAWSKVTQGKTTFWTQDGLGLQTLRFVGGIEDGDTLFEGMRVATESEPPQFDPAMSPLEIKDFLVASARAGGATRIEVTNFVPQKIDGRDAFRGDYAFTDKDGLIRKGFAVFFVHDRKLYAIVYEGSALHYYSKAKDDAERVISSLTFL